jgi:hypothetical protein
MNARQRLNRIAKLQELLCPKSDGSVTLEELCRSMWRRNKKNFREIAEESSYPYQLFVYQFEQEDADAASMAARRVAARK